MSLLWLSRTLPTHDQLRVRAYPAQLVSIGDLFMRSHVFLQSAGVRYLLAVTLPSSLEQS